MGRILTLTLMASLLLTGAAWADDDAWAEDDVIREDVLVAANRDFVEATPVDRQTLLVSDPARLGMYFGAGDELVLAGAYRDEGLAYSPRADIAHGTTTRTYDSDLSYYNQPVYAPRTGDAHAQEGYGYDNVYGPLWGVPEDASGMEGYQPGYYFLSGTADGQGQPVHTHATADSGGDDSASGDEADGIDIGESEDWGD